MQNVNFKLSRIERFHQVSSLDSLDGRHLKKGLVVALPVCLPSIPHWTAVVWIQKSPLNKKKTKEQNRQSKWTKKKKKRKKKKSCLDYNIFKQLWNTQNLIIDRWHLCTITLWIFKFWVYLPILWLGNELIPRMKAHFTFPHLFFQLSFSQLPIFSLSSLLSTW